MLGGRPDLVYEASGSATALQAAIDAVADEGTVTVCSWFGTRTVPLMLGGRFHRGRIHLRASQVGRIAPELGGRWGYPRRRQAVLALLSEMPLERLISHRFAFEEAPEAYALVAGRSDETVQVILTYGETSPLRAPSSTNCPGPLSAARDRCAASPRPDGPAPTTPAQSLTPAVSPSGRGGEMDSLGVPCELRGCDSGADRSAPPGGAGVAPA